MSHRTVVVVKLHATVVNLRPSLPTERVTIILSFLLIGLLLHSENSLGYLMKVTDYADSRAT